MKKTPLAAVVETLGVDGVSRPVGTVDFKILHAPSGLISGALLSPAGELLGQVSISGIDLAALGNAKVGRPRADEKKLAVLLAWALRCEELGGKRGLADEQTASQFGYSDAKKVRDIRAELAKSLELDLDCCVASVGEDGENDPPACSVLIRKPTYYLSNGTAEILGVGDLWTANFGCHVKSGMAIKVDIPNVANAESFAKMKAYGGPIIVALLRPGR